MAYGYTAAYGYYMDPDGTAGFADISGQDFTSSKFHIESDYTIFTLPESLELPAPHSNRRTDPETAAFRRLTLTEYNYVCLLPYCNEADIANDYDSYSKWYTSIEMLMPGAFFYCRPLVSKCYDLIGTRYATFVWLKDIDIVIDTYGSMYKIQNNILTRLFSSGNYFTFNAVLDNYIPGPNPFGILKDTQGDVDVAYMYSGSWYRSTFSSASFVKPDPVEGLQDNIEYTIWTGQNRTSTQQNIINRELVGTPDNPKYKYKTDPADPNTDPYTPPFDPIGPSKPGGGEGTHEPNPENDPAPIPDITQMTSILDTDFMTAYKMTAGGLKNLGAFLWSQSFYGAIASVLNSPFDVIIGLHIVPVNPSIESNARAILLGNVDSNIAGYRVTSQYVEKDLGGFDVPHIWGAYLDYQGKFEIFLPFIGFRSIAADDIVGHQIRVKYHIDVVTGACIAYILTDNYVTYTFAGSCSYNIPVTGQNFSNIVASMIQTAGTIGMAAIAPEGMGAAGAMAAAGSALNTAMSKATYSRSGGMGGNNAFMGMRTPVLIARVPNIAIPGNQNKIVGYPSFITRTLSEVHGYTEVYKVHLEGIGASDTEKSEIETALMEGVIL